MHIRAFVSLFTVLLVGLRLHASAQQTGVYLTAADFDNHILSFTKEADKKYKFKIHEVFHTQTITIVKSDTVITLLKDSIFGYRDEDNIPYRFYNKKTYQIINPTEKILLYCLTTPIALKGSEPIIRYFFSTNSASAIYALTKLNLKKAFPLDTNFHELIDMYFNNDTDLLAYDQFYHVYKINRIYQLKK